MDKPRLSITPHSCRRIGAEAAPKRLDVSRPADPSRESSMIVYCEQELREGFAVALRAMGVGADIVPPAPNSTRESN
jgi:hypothetical protein